MGPIGSKVIEVKGQICFFSVGHVFFCLFPYFSQVLGPILKVKVIEVKGQIFCISAVLGPICMKLGECIQGDP